MFNDVLTARENRRKVIENLSKDANVVSVKANVVGAIKNLPTSRLLLSYFTKKIERLGAENLKLILSADGDTVVCRVKNGALAKEKAVFLEERELLGRFIDIDVTLRGQTESISRGSLRKCYLCSNPAFVCGKNKTHTLKELLDYFNGKIYQETYKVIQNIIIESLLGELNLENKFGLVTPTDNGSHIDLNYDVMKRAGEKIACVLPEAFFIGLNTTETDELFEKLQVIGLQAEKVMFNETDGINAYKGFIFMACVLLGATGYAVASHLSYSKIYQTVKEICKSFDKTSADTFGYKAYLDGFGGIRKNAKEGFVVVDYAKNLLGDDNALQVLAKIVGKIDDSVLLKRAKTYEKYTYYKDLISKLDCLNLDELSRVNEQCIKENISIGGSADVLISAIMMKKLTETFYFWE